MDALFLSRKSSVSGSIPSLSLIDDVRCDPHPFSSPVNMMAATDIRPAPKTVVKDLNSSHYNMTPKLNCPYFNPENLSLDKLANFNFLKEFQNCVQSTKSKSLRLIILENHLRGYAQKIINLLSISEANFDIAVKILRFGLKKLKKLRQISEKAVCPRSETDRRRKKERKKEKRSGKRRGEEKKKDYPVSKRRT